MMIVLSLFSGIIGCLLTLVCSSARENNTRKRERKILKQALVSECGLQDHILTAIEEWHARPYGVNPARFSLAVFEHGLNRHIVVFGNIELIQKLSQLTVNVKALNTTLDRYEQELLAALKNNHVPENVEIMRKGIRNCIQMCRTALIAVKLASENDK